MGRIEDLLLVEQAGQLPSEMQRDLDTLRKAGVVLGGERAMPGSAEAVGQPVPSPAGSETATPTTTGKGESILPATGGAVVGGFRGAQLGGRFGGMPGRVIGGLIGAGIGAAGGEATQIGAERADRVPAASAPPQALASRVLGAAEKGVEGQAGGEVLGLVGKGLQAGFRAAMPTVTKGARYAAGKLIPLGLSELAPTVRRGVFGSIVQKAAESGLFGKAAQQQSDAVAAALQREIAAAGGALDAGEYGRGAQAAMRRTYATLRRSLAKMKPAPAAPPALYGPNDKLLPMSRKAASAIKSGTTRVKNRVAKASPVLASLKQFIGTTLNTGQIVHALFKDNIQTNAVHLAQTLTEMGPEAVGEMRRAWLTGLLEHVTSRGGLGAGVGHGETAAARGGELGERGQQLLFADTAPRMGQFFDLLSQTSVSSSFGTAKTAMSPMLRGLTAVLGASGFGALGGAYYGAGGRRGALEGALAGGSAVLAPYLAAKLLVSPGGVEFLTGVTNAAHNPGTFSQALPGLVRAGSQLIGQALGPVLQPPGVSAPQSLAAPSAPPAGRTLGPFTLAAPVPQEPVSRTLTPLPTREPVAPSARPLPGFP